MGLLDNEQLIAAVKDTNYDAMMLYNSITHMGDNSAAVQRIIGTRRLSSEYSQGGQGVPSQYQHERSSTVDVDDEYGAYHDAI